MKIYKVYLRNILIKLKLKGPKYGYVVFILLYVMNGTTKFKLTNRFSMLGAAPLASVALEINT